MVGASVLDSVLVGALLGCEDGAAEGAALGDADGAVLVGLQVEHIRSHNCR